MTAAATKVDFYAGAPPAPPQFDIGPSVWPYRQHWHPNGGWAPIVDVLLLGPMNWCETDALLDSGADVSALPYGWAEPLGVDLDRAEAKTAWGNGIFAEYLFPVERLSVELAGRVIPLRAAFTPWYHLVLGRDAFEAFTIIFKERERCVILSPNEPSP